MVRPKGGRAQPRYFQYKEQSEKRFIAAAGKIKRKKTKVHHRIYHIIAFVDSHINIAKQTLKELKALRS